MCLQDWANLSAVIQGIVLPLSVVLLIIQIRRQSQLTRAANAQSLVEIASPLNLLLAQDEKLAAIWHTGQKEPAKLTPLEKERYDFLVNWYLLLHENIFHQHARSLIDESLYDSWKRDLGYFLRAHHVADRWGKLRPFFHVEFAEHIDTLVK